MEIAESVHTGRVRQTRVRDVFQRQDFFFYNFTRALYRQIVMGYVEVFKIKIFSCLKIYVYYICIIFLNIYKHIVFQIKR